MPKQTKSGLAAGRPPLAQKRKRNMGAKATRTIIRGHHQLQKRLHDAQRGGKLAQAAALEGEIEARGGLKKYQEASILGQSIDRGGDSSKVLMRWLRERRIVSEGAGEKLKFLEVGALSTTNACSRSRLFDMTWIDLNSQDAKIEKQDFMARPLPSSDSQRFDIISLSLVLNYVSHAKERGDMLRRTTEFLGERKEGSVLPLLFLVLPGACITNSRYMDENRLEQIMRALGYVKLEHKISPKLYYSLWNLESKSRKPIETFSKVEVNPGKSKNNFSIVLR